MVGDLWKHSQFSETEPAKMEHSIIQGGIFQLNLWVNTF